MVFSGQIGQTTYNQYMPEGMPGTLEGMGNYIGMPYRNASAARQAVYTVTPPETPDASTAYTLTVDGVTVSVTTGGSTTTAQLGALLYAALRAEGQIYRLYEISLNGSTGVVTLTHRMFNTAGTITTNSAATTGDLTIATATAVGSATTIPFGRFVGRLSSYSVDVNGMSDAALVNHASNFTVLGVTLKQVFEKSAVGPDAVAKYPFTAIMNVVEDTGTHKGVWVEAVDSDIVLTDSVYIDISSDGGGKVTKTSTSNCNISSVAKFVSKSVIGPTGSPIVCVRYSRYGF